MIQYGDADAVLTGGSEAALTPLVQGRVRGLDAVSPTGISRPFDARRDGFVMGEGGAVLVLEDAEKAAGARRRGPGDPARLRRHLGRAPPDRAPPRGGGAPAAIARALEDSGHQARGHQLRQRPRHLDAAQRPRRDQGDQGSARRPRAQRAGLVDQVCDRPPAGSRRSRRGDRDDPGAARADRAAHAGVGGARGGHGPRLRARLGQAAGRQRWTGGRAEQRVRLRRPQRGPVLEPPSAVAGELARPGCRLRSRAEDDPL